MTLPHEIQCRSRRDPLVDPRQIDSHVADMTATIAADVPLETVQTHLAQFNHLLMRYSELLSVLTPTAKTRRSRARLKILAVQRHFLLLISRRDGR